MEERWVRQRGVGVGFACAAVADPVCEGDSVGNPPSPRNPPSERQCKIRTDYISPGSEELLLVEFGYCPSPVAPRGQCPATSIQRSHGSSFSLPLFSAAAGSLQPSTPLATTPHPLTLLQVFCARCSSTGGKNGVLHGEGCAECAVVRGAGHGGGKKRGLLPGGVVNLRW